MIADFCTVFVDARRENYVDLGASHAECTRKVRTLQAIGYTGRVLIEPRLGGDGYRIDAEREAFAAFCDTLVSVGRDIKQYGCRRIVSRDG